MYINLTVKFLPKAWERNFNKKEADVIKDFMNEMSLKSSQDLLSKDCLSFKFRLTDEKREQILGFTEKNCNKIDICLYADTCYEEKDFDEAAAFILKFPKSFQYYDDWNDEKYESFVMTCAKSPEDINSQACGTWEHTEKIFAKPNMGIKKAFDNKYSGATSYEASDASIISQKLAEYLMEQGISEDFFTPVHQKRGDSWAYFLDGRKNLIPSGQLFCSWIDGSTICSVCGKHLMMRKENKQLDELNDRLVDVICLGNPFQGDRWEITTEAAANLQPVNLTEDFFISKQMTLINKELFSLIHMQVPEVVKKTVPVFIQRA